MFNDTIKRLYSEESGMEMVEWAIVAVFFAVAGVTLWGDVATKVEEALTKVMTEMDKGIQ